MCYENCELCRTNSNDENNQKCVICKDKYVNQDGNCNDRPDLYNNHYLNKKCNDFFQFHKYDNFGHILGIHVFFHSKNN